MIRYQTRLTDQSILLANNQTKRPREAEFYISHKYIKKNEEEKKGEEEIKRVEQFFLQKDISQIDEFTENLHWKLLV